MTSQCKAMLKLALCVLTLVVCFHAGTSAASEVVIYNKGNTTAYLARVEAVSLLGVTRYRAIGWVKLQEGEHVTIYDADDPDPLYVGYTYLDEADVDHVSVTHPEQSEDGYVHYSDKRFCVTPRDEFDYWGKTIEDMQTCKPGFVPMQFTLYFDVRSDSYDNVTERYIIEPDFNLEYASADPEFNKPAGPGKLNDLAPILNGAVDGATEFKSFVANHQPPIKSVYVYWCMTDDVVQRQSWSDPQSAHAVALKTILGKFLAGHDFSDAASKAAVPLPYVPAGTMFAFLHIREVNGTFDVLEGGDCGSGEASLTTHMPVNPDTRPQQVRANAVPQSGSNAAPAAPASLDEQLVQAVNARNPFAVTKLLGRGANVNAHVMGGPTPLEGAAMLNAKDVAVVLLAHGADVSSVDGTGATPLHWAVVANSLPVAELLLAHDAPVNARDAKGKTPLDYALDYSAKYPATSPAMANLLRTHGGIK